MHARLARHIAETITRLGGLPKPLPSFIAEDINRMPPTEKRGLFERLKAASTGPILSLHVAKLLMDLGENREASIQFLNGVIKKLIPVQNTGQTAAFKSLLGWVSAECKSRNLSWTLDQSALVPLIWLHASRLYSIFSEVGAPDQWIDEFFAEKTGVSPDTWDLLSKSRPDVADSAQFSGLSFLFSGLYYVLETASVSVLDEETRKKCAALAFPWVEHPELPAVSLFRDWSTVTNKLGLLLGAGDIAAAIAVAETVDGKDRQPPDYQSIADQALQQAAAGDIADAWIQLSAVFRDAPVHPNHTKIVTQIVTSVNLESIFAADPQHGFVALLFCANQVRHLSDKLAAHALREKLITLADYLCRNPLTDNPNEQGPELARLLLDPALHTSFALSDTAPFDAFAALLREMTQKCATFIPQLRRTLKQLVDELPAAKVEKLEEVMVQLRAA